MSLVWFVFGSDLVDEKRVGLFGLRWLKSLLVWRAGKELHDVIEPGRWEGPHLFPGLVQICQDIIVFIFKFISLFIFISCSSLLALCYNTLIPNEAR